MRKTVLTTIVLALCFGIGSLFGQGCQADFNAWPDTSGQSCSVSFQNTSSGVGLNYFYDFGDGNFAYTPNPVHTYANSGTYTVCMTVWDSINCVDSTCHPVTVQCGSGSNCQAAFNAWPDTTGQSCHVYFQNNSSGSAGTTYHWSFGDGSSSTAASPTHTYNSSGTYWACLSVFDGNCFDSLCVPVTVQCGSGSNCQANFQAYPDTNGNCIVWFNNNSTGSNLSYYWDFGDSSYSTSSNPSHTYSGSGTYVACLIVWNSTCADTVCYPVTVQCGSGSNCQAGFNAWPDTSGQSCHVYFQNTSSGNGLNYYWSFGDGNWSNATNPTHTYSAAGTYQVCLTAYGANCSDTICQNVTVQCGSGTNCQANFIATPDSGCGYFFQNTSTGSPNLTYHWSFGDGTSSTSQNPYHIYNAGGTYWVCLSVFDGNCFDSLCVPVTVQCGPAGCQAGFNAYPDTTGQNCTVWFGNTSSGNNINYFWQFGDGTSSNQTNPVHTYAASGTYTVCLSVWNNGCQDTICQNVTVQCGSGSNCHADFQAYPDTSGQNCTAWFTNTSTGSNLNYFWQFGDGSTSNLANPVHTYPSSGTYTACLTVWNSTCSDTICYPVTVQCGSGSNCQAGFNAWPDTSGQSCAVYFQNSSTGSGLNYNWNFGDGTSTGLTNPSHTYASSGNYLVCLTVWNSTNCVDSICQFVTVQCGQSNCQANFNAYPDSLCGFYFQNNSTGSANASYNWSFGDGTYSTSANPYHTYNGSGTYIVCLSIFDGNCYDSTCVPITVNCGSGGSCNADFAAYPDTNGQCVVWFNNNSTGNNLNYFWQFGDGSTSSSSNPAHTYANSGTYTACLTVWNSTCADTICYPVTVQCGSGSNCQASFNAYPDTSGQSCHVYFQNTSTGTGLNYYWSFGDGNWSNASNPTHTYAAAGTYQVCLTAYGANCSDTICQNVTVQCGSGTNCQANFIATPDSGCGYFFQNTSTGSPNLTYHWSFGDGTSSTTQNPYHIYNAGGTYWVCLSIFDGNCFDSLCVPVTVNCGPAGCNASFSAYPDTTGQSCTVWFGNSSSGNNINYFWQFGDGTTSNQTNPVHSYAASGTYTVCLTVWNSGCQDTICQNVTVQCGSQQNCQAAFNAYPDTTGQTCNVWFNNNSTGSNLNYFWQFGDGTTSNQANPVHSYSQTGTYLACLTVWNSTCADTICSPVTVFCSSTQNCQADFNAWPDTTGQSCHVYFQNTSTGNGLNYYWSFGDGNWSNAANPTHTYAASGTYNACLTVWNSTCADTICYPVTVHCGTNPVCQAGFAAYPDSTGQTCEVWFLDQAVHSGLASYYWSFGDGNGSNAQNPVHTYAHSGTYTVCQTIWDSLCVDTLCQTITINCIGNNIQPGLDEDFDLTVYPNPMTTELNIQYELPQSAEVQFRLVDLHGKILTEINQGTQFSGGHTYALPTEQLAKGLYFLHIQIDGGQIVRKVIKE